MAAENYHLKWDSHLSYLNSSVATLYKNEKFADVVLYSSSSISSSNGNAADCGIPTVGISAHKFILSSCSQFFATMFETAPISAPNSVLYVVLPPDLSHRAIQILVQYMYSGEATVANDILSEVLRGGEILKIRGLCRTSSSAGNSSTHHHHQHPHQRNEAVGAGSSVPHYGANGTRPPPMPPVQHAPISGEMYGAGNGATSSNSKCPSLSGGNCGARYSIEQSSAPPPPSTQPPPTHAHSHSHAPQHQHQHHQFRGLGASVMPKDSPVIVKSPKMQQLPLLPPHGSKHHGGISVNKEVAIDPEEKCCYQLSTHETLPVASGMCGEVGCSGNGCAMSSSEAEQLQMRRRSQSDEALNTPSRVEQHQQLERKYSERPRPAPDEQCERDQVDMVNYERRLRRGSGGVERMRDYFVPEHYDHDVMSSRGLGSTPPHSHGFLTIKQEPADWSASANAEMQHNDIANRAPTPPIHSPKQPLDFKMPLGSAAVKMETGTSCQSADEEESAAAVLAGHAANEYDNNFSRLVCEICKKTFDEPKAWVRHLESHATGPSPVVGVVGSSGGPAGASSGSAGTATAAAISSDTITKSYVPKKRRRVSQQENHVDHVTLLCDLCSTSFETPAEWVRHMNNQHTEIELAMFNSKKDTEQKTHAYANSSTVSSSSSANATNNNTNNSSNGTSQSSNTSSSNHQNAPTTQHKKYTNRTTGYNFGGAEHSSAAAAERTCDICSKKFSTHNHMLAHKRSHSVSATANGSIGMATSPLATSSANAAMANANNESYNVTPSQA